jgi:DNA repair protein REV1
MWLSQARKLCPDLVVVGYQFDKYEKVSMSMFRILAKYTTRIQVLSCDEALLDMSGTADTSGMARRIRSDIFDSTGCPASIGIGPNILLARLATREAKPNGQFELCADNARQLVCRMAVADLPGVGGAMQKQLASLGVNLCSVYYRFGATNSRHASKCRCSVVC